MKKNEKRRKRKAARLPIGRQERQRKTATVIMKNSALSKSSSHYRRERGEWPHPLKSTSTWRQRRHSFSFSSLLSRLSRSARLFSISKHRIDRLKWRQLFSSYSYLSTQKNKEHKHSILCLSFTICISHRVARTRARNESSPISLLSRRARACTASNCFDNSRERVETF